MTPIVVAVDGAAGSGKSTLSRRLAVVLNIAYLNTGLMYRALAAAALRAGTSPDDADALLELAEDLRFTLADGRPVSLDVEGYDVEELTSVEVESTVSIVARHPAVRAWMRERQRALGEAGAVVEGRDIASVVFPDAPVKLFLEAGTAARAARRASERRDAGDAVADALRDRDTLDARTNPLVPTADATVIDTDALDVEETLAAALAAVRRVWPEAGR